MHVKCGDTAEYILKTPQSVCLSYHSMKGWVQPSGSCSDGLFKNVS